MSTVETLDITPSPRVLRMLGEIPFFPWQCIAEFIDNSIDAFARADAAGIRLSSKRIIVSWSEESVPPPNRTVEVTDTGPGMEISAIQDCVRAGYSRNDPIHNLGLFGMGFNIATARLGAKTQFLSATRESATWSGVEIDFDALQRIGSFRAPKVELPKSSPDECGTKIIVSRLKPGIESELRNSATQIRRILEDVYAPILRETEIEIMVQSRILRPRKYCVWGSNRFVVYGGERVPGVIHVDKTVGESLFDVLKNRYLTPEEEDAEKERFAQVGSYSENVVRRTKRIHGWLGIQRYADPVDFGISFVRNGRKILLRDKTLFTYENSLVATQEIEYPVELGNTVGGRIIGEIHIDHVPPTYQKNDFDRADLSWREVVETLRGSGPILPLKRRHLGLEPVNNSPLAMLVNAYRRADQGTRNLAAPNPKAREWAKLFEAGDPEYESDEKWWKAAQEADRDRAEKGARSSSAVNSGSTSSDDAERYKPANQASHTTTQGPQPVVVPVARSSQDEIEALKARSQRLETYSGDYAYQGCSAPFKVEVYEVQSGKLIQNGEEVPCILHRDGVENTFFFDPRHPFLVNFRTSFRDLLLVYLADRFKARDDLSDIGFIYRTLVERHAQDSRLDLSTLQENASVFFDRLREKMISRLAVREREVVDCIYESAGEVEETVGALISSPDLLARFQCREIGSINALAVVPIRTLLRLVERFPEELFDGKCFRTPYRMIELPDQNSTDRLRSAAKDRILSFLKDALWVSTEAQGSALPRRRKDELARCVHSLSFLNEETNELP